MLSEPRGEDFFADTNFDDKEFLLTYWGPRSTTKTSNFDYVGEVHEGKHAVFIETSDKNNSGMARFINDKDRSVTGNCQMKKVTDDQSRNYCIFLANRPIQSGWLDFFRDRRSFKTQCESHQVDEAWWDFERFCSNTHFEGPAIIVHGLKVLLASSRLFALCDAMCHMKFHQGLVKSGVYVPPTPIS